MKASLHHMLDRLPALKRLLTRAMWALEPLTGRARRRAQRRLQLALRCTDTEPIPKVPGAGDIVVEQGQRVQIMHNGVRILAGGYQSDWMSELIRGLRGHHEPQEERVFHEVLKQVRPDANMIELGAWWAYYSLWFLQGQPGRRAFLIEPVSERIEVGRRNFVINGLQADFTVGFLGDVHAGADGRFTDWDGSMHDVPQIDLDQFVAAKGIDFIDILHSDIQGGERDMLQSIRPLLEARRIGYLFISTHLDYHQPCRDLLQAAGYREIAEHTIAQSYSADGLIVAQCERVPHVPAIPVSRR